MAAVESYPVELKYHRDHDWARIEADEAVLAHRLRELRDTLDDLVAGDAAVDDDVTHVDPLGTIGACHRLRQRTQPGFCRREGRRVRLPAQRRGRAREEHGSAAARQHPPQGLAADQEAAEASHAPHLLEEARLHVVGLPHRGVAGVVDDEIEDTFAVRLGAIEERDHVPLDRRIRGDARCTAARVPNRDDQRLHLRRGPSSHEDVEPFPSQPRRKGSAEPGLGSHADDDGLRLVAHASCPP